MPAAEYQYDLDDLDDRTSSIKLPVQELMDTRAFMGSIQQYPVLSDSPAVSCLGQNGILKDSTGLVIAIDLNLSNSCASIFSHLPCRLDREPKDLLIAAHSHDDPADPETIRRLDNKNRKIEFVGPFDAMQIYPRCGVSASATQLLHPGEGITDRVIFILAYSSDCKENW